MSCFRFLLGYKMKRIHVLGIAGLLGLSGCGYESHYKDPTESFVLPAINSSVDQIIAGEAQQAVAAQRSLAMVQRAQNPGVMAVDPNAGAPDALLTNVTVANYTGPIGPFVKSLAQRAGYRYVEPQIPISEQPGVSLNIENRTIAEALDDASLQVQNALQIVINPAARTMTIRKFVPVRGNMVDNPAINASERQPAPAAPKKIVHRKPVHHVSSMSFGDDSGTSESHGRHVWKTQASHS